MDIALGILSIPGCTPAWHRQNADLLIVANGFGWHARSAGELADGQQSRHGRSSLSRLWMERYTFH
jgi:hypothetical protein